MPAQFARLPEHPGSLVSHHVAACPAQEMVSVVKDPSSDLAVLSKKGSDVRARVVCVFVRVSKLIASLRGSSGSSLALHGSLMHSC